MQQTLLILALVAALLATLWLFRRRPAPPAAPHRPNTRGVESLDTLMAWQPTPTRVLNISECQAYHLLRRALPEHMILAQVPLARFLKVPTRHSYTEWLRRAGQLCVDVMVCDLNSQVVGVIEIRQPDGQESDRTKRRQARMDRVLQAAGIPLHVWRADLLPSATVAREVLIESHQKTRNTMASGPTVSVDSTLPEGASGQIDLERGALDNFGMNSGFEPRDPPPSTWFDDLDSAPMPLGSAPASARR